MNLNSNKNLWLETDVEPDDQLAYLIYLLHGYCFSHIVVGESNPLLKAKKMYLLLKTLGFNPNNTPIIMGKGSDRNYDTEGSEFGNLMEEVKDEFTQDYSGKLKEFLDNEENPTMVMLKPPREAFEEFVKNNQVFNKATVYIYGGFNLRSLYLDRDQNKMNNKIVEVNNFLKSFKKVILFETFHAFGKNNGINSKDSPLVFDALEKNFPEYTNYLYESSLNWDSSNLISQCKRLLKMLKGDNNMLIKLLSCNDTNELSTLLTDFKFNNNDFGSIERSWKIITSKDEKIVFTVLRNMGIKDENMVSVKRLKSSGRYTQQLVFADFGLATVMENPKFDKNLIQVDISFNDSCTNIVNSKDSNCYAYKNVDRQEIENEIIQVLYKK